MIRFTLVYRSTVFKCSRLLKAETLTGLQDEELQLANCVQPLFWVVFVLLPHLHNSFNELGVKTMQTAHANKQRHQRKQ